MNNKAIFLYGTLRKGGHFSKVMPVSKKSTIYKITGIRMYNLYAYPAVIITNNNEDYTIGELHDYSNLSNVEWSKLIRQLDIIENVARKLYERNIIKTSFGNTVLYTANRSWFDEEIKYAQKIKKPYPIIHDWAYEDSGVKNMLIKNFKQKKTK